MSYLAYPNAPIVRDLAIEKPDTIMSDTFGGIHGEWLEKPYYFIDIHKEWFDKGSYLRQHILQDGTYGPITAYKNNDHTVMMQPQEAKNANGDIVLYPPGTGHVDDSLLSHQESYSDTVADVLGFTFEGISLPKLSEIEVHTRQMDAQYIIKGTWDPDVYGFKEYAAKQQWLEDMEDTIDNVRDWTSDVSSTVSSTVSKSIEENPEIVAFLSAGTLLSVWWGVRGNKAASTPKDSEPSDPKRNDTAESLAVAEPDEEEEEELNCHTAKVTQWRGDKMMTQLKRVCQSQDVALPETEMIEYTPR